MYTLWRKTVAGMSPEEAKALLSDAVEPSGQPSWLEDGAIELLRVERFELVNEIFSVSLFFKERRLSQVTLSLVEQVPFASALRTFNSVSEALCAKYGQEISRHVSDEPFPNAKATWLSGRVNIGITVLSVVPDSLVFNINYQTSLAREADKL